MRREERFYEGYSQGIHPNPRFFKYRWWVFWEGSLEEGWDFIHNEDYSLCTAKFLKVRERLLDEQQPQMVYNSKYLRRGSQLWDIMVPGHRRWCLPIAVAYDDDLDPAWRGHK